jgi:DNA polymerase I-like protein with 3'-5' exonuclease and polymerase domains
MQLSMFQETHALDYAALQRCLKAEAVSVDIETDTRWPGRGPKLDYGLSYSAAVTVIALAWPENGQISTTVLAAPFDEQTVDFLKTLFARSVPIIAHNAVFDTRQLSKLTGGLIPNLIWDTQSMARLLHPEVNISYSLLSVAAMLNIPVPERQEAMKGQRSKLHMLPLELTLQYAQDDARLALQIYQKQRTIPCDADLINWECRALHEYCRMAAEGIRLNVPFTQQRLTELGQQREELAKRLQADGLLTPSSPKARVKYLYETKGIPLPKWDPNSWYFTRAGRHRLSADPKAQVELSDLSTRSYVIESYLEEGSPYYDQLKDLAAYAEVDWLISTLEGLIDHAELDGRLHSMVTIATESGRRASSYPHMQNWKMPAMAGVAIGDEGFTLVEIDYSNAENVMAAMIAGDSNLSAACQAEDFHSVMGAEYFGKQWQEADASERKRLRNLSKKITYGTAYGMGAKRLGESINVSTAEAKRIMRAKDAAFPRVTHWRTVAQKQVEDTHRLKLWTGRPVAVPSAFVAWNYICQGGVSEMLKRAIVVVSETYRAKGMRSRVALDMHDALILEVAHEEWDEALKLASRVMTTITPENLINRTKPPIRWVAEPNLKENAHKWGAEQWHPGAERKS